MVFFPIITLSITTVLLRFFTKTWISPAAFFSACWSFFIVVPIIFASEYKVDHLALWFITIFSMALGAGSLIAYSYYRPSSSIKNINFKTNYQFFYYCLLLFCSISCIGLYLLIRHVSDIYMSDSYVNNWLMIPNMIAADRYAEELNYTFFIKYCLYFIYPGNLLGGLLFGLIEKSPKIKFFSIVPLLLSVLLGIIEGARTSILLGLVLFFSAWISAFVFRGTHLSQRNKLSFKFTFFIGMIISLFTIFFVLIQWLRQGMDTIIIELLIDRIRAYFFGYLAAFSQWINALEVVNYDFGFITFAGPFNLIGVMERPLGFYNPVNITNNISTNIFTAFRGIVIDFSISGAILIAFIIGFITQTIFQKENQKTLLSTLPLSMFYAFTLYSPLISIFHYNSILFSWLILSIVLILSNNDPLDNYS